MKDTFYFIFDGNFPELSILECKTILNGLNPGGTFSPPCKIMNEFYYFFSFSSSYLTDIKFFQEYSRLTSLTREIGILYHLMDINLEESFESILINMLSILKNSISSFKISPKTKFKVELEKKGIIDETIFNARNRTTLLIDIADFFIDNFDLKTDLNDPLYLITIFLLPKQAIIGQRLFKPNRRSIMNRTPSNRAYFHPGSMNPILIRTMVNLALLSHYFPLKNREIDKKIFLDPFMGGGGMLIEAGEMGYVTIGVELAYWMARGARMNLRDITQSGYDLNSWTICRGDSNKIPLKSESVDIIVTDPPYGHSTILGGYKIEDLLINVLSECFRVLKKNSRMVISIPSHITIPFGKFEIITHISDKVHSSLTRIIYILEKK